MSRQVLIAPDSLKGGPTSLVVADAIADGWRRRAPGDVLTCLPMADGGEGTLDAIAATAPGAEIITVPDVHGPDGRRVDGAYLRLVDGTAVVELATASGLPLLRRPDPMGATTLGTGEVIRAALATGARRLVLAVGGSASTDGGAGIMRALGARFLDEDGRDLPEGGGSLERLRAVDTTMLLTAPPDGVDVLVDVSNPLVGLSGAARTYGPQKGASPRQVAELDAALVVLARHLQIDPTLPGSGAAGGVPVALMALWGARLHPGAEAIAELTGLQGAIDANDVVVTAEGTFDDTSLQGKVVGYVLEVARATGTPALLVAGQVGVPPPDGVLSHICLSDLAGSATASMARPELYLAMAGGQLASLANSTAAGRGGVLPSRC